jgi:FkbM family methyltransferase
VRYPPFGGDLKALLDRLAVDCVLDVGAFTGTYGRLLRGLGYTGRIVSYEPAAENFAALERESAADPQWLARKLAVGAEPGTLELRLTGSPGCNSFLAPNEYARRELPGMFELRGVERVQVVTLDEQLADAAGGARAIFVKLDTQGFDLEALRGGAHTLERAALLQVELSLQHTYEGQPGYLVLLGELEQRGFAPALLTPTFRDSAGRVVECDCVLLRGGTPGSPASPLLPYAGR